jgi:hypothetical protein
MLLVLTGTYLDNTLAELRQFLHRAVTVQRRNEFAAFFDKKG